MARHKNIEWKKVQAKLQAKKRNFGRFMKWKEPVENRMWWGMIQKATNIASTIALRKVQKIEEVFATIRTLDKRKTHKPKDSAVNLAMIMGIELLDEEQYRALQKLGDFDTQTSSWLKNPLDIRKKGGAIFGDFRYGNVFIYHNSAESYYASRGF